MLSAFLTSHSIPHLVVAATNAPSLTAEDKAWFSGSKVVDRNGKPLVVYHGSHSPLVGEFKPTPNEEVVGKSVGFYFTPDEFTAESYGPHVSAHIIKASRVLVLPQNLKYAQARRLVALLGIDNSQLDAVIKTVGPKRGFIRAFHLLKDGDSDWGGEDLKLGSMVLEALKARGVECVRFIEGRFDAEYIEHVTYCVFDPKLIRTIGTDIDVTTVQHTEVTAARAPVVVPPINPEDKAEFDDWALSGLILDHNEEPLVLFHGGGGRELDATDWYTPDIRNTREFGPVVDCVHLRMLHPASEDDLMGIYNEVFHTNFTWDELLEDEDRMFGSLADFLEENDKYYTAVRAKHDGFILSNDDTIEHQGPSYRVFDIDDVWKLGRISR